MGDLSGVFWPLEGGFGVAAAAVLGSVDVLESVGERVDARAPGWERVCMRFWFRVDMG